MSNAGYGNHDASMPGSATSEPAPPRGGSIRSADGSPPTADAPTSPAPAAGKQSGAAAAGDGASPAKPQGDEVDPGVG